MKIELDREDDGRWIAEVPDLPGVMSYGEMREDAVSSVKALALRVLADRLEHGELIPELAEIFQVAVHSFCPSAGCAASDWLADQTAVRRIASDFGERGLAGLRVCIS